MDSLRHIIQNLKKEEIRNFKIYTNRFQRQDEIKIATLFDLMRAEKSEHDDKKLVAQLFPEEPDNMNAFYRLKNRLKTELEKSLLNLHHNLDDKVNTINYITLSSIFTYKAEYDLALYYLKKAEKVAAANEFYDLLDLIYNQIIALGHNFNEINPIEYIEKIKENLRKNKVVMDANHAIASISYKLRKTNFNKSEEELSLTMQRILDELQIANEVYKIPHVKFKIYQVVRDTLYQAKDLNRLEIYLKDTLKEFEQENLFTKSNHTQKIKMIIWIINILMINKKWPESLHYTELLHEELQKYNKLHYDTFIWGYYQSLFTNFISSNRMPDAIQLLEQIKELPQHKGVMFYDHAIHVNLALSYYFSRNLTAAIRTLSHLLGKDLYPKLETELQFSTSMLEIILHYDNDNFDYVSYRIGELKRQFRGLLKRPEYQDEKVFLKILHNMCNRPDPLHDKSILAQMNQFVIQASSLQVGSGRHIDYSLWIQSKMRRLPYYACLLETLQAPVAAEQ